MPDDRATSQTQPQSAAIPSWVTPALIAQTKVVWQPYFEEELTDAAALELLVPVGVLYEVLYTEKSGNQEADELDESGELVCAGADQ